MFSILKYSYTLLSPIYDLIVAGPTQHVRQQSLQRLESLSNSNDHILLMGIGTGLDIPFLPGQRRYTGIDLTPSMLAAARRRAGAKAIQLDIGNVMSLPYEDESFDQVVMHLILAVVADPDAALREAQRVLKPGGHIVIVDKFLKKNQMAPIRRLVNIVIRHIATRTDVIFEKLLENSQPTLGLVSDEPVLLKGWFRNIVLRKQTA